jgi:hypothetical protein
MAPGRGMLIRKQACSTQELIKSDGGPLKSLDATSIKADDLEEAKIAALKWAGEKATPGFGETLVLQLARRGRGVFTHTYPEQADDGGT